MKKYISTTVFLLLFLSNIFSQTLKTIKIKTPKPIDTKEIFQVLKSNPEVKNGEYKKYKNKELIEKGFFKDNKKDSSWNIFSQSGQMLAAGKYKLDQKIGVWNFYSKGGIIVQKYDYDKDSLIYFNVNEEKKFGYAPSIYPDTAQQQMPIFIGGVSYMYALIENNIIYPKAAWDKQETAKVIVSFVVDDFGNTTKVEVIKKMSDGFDEEAIKMVESFRKSWIPGIQRGKKVRVQYNLPLNFKLE